MFTFDLRGTNTKHKSSQLPAICSTKTCLQTERLNDVKALSKLISVWACRLETAQYKDPGTALKEENSVILSLCQPRVCNISRRLVVI